MEEMEMKRVLFAGLFLGVMLFAVHALMAGAVMDVKSSLAGTVTWTAEPGSTLTAGAEIVRVRTLTGEAAAARAEDGCRMSETLVAVGDDVAVGQIVARVEKQE